MKKRMDEENDEKKSAEAQRRKEIKRDGGRKRQRNKDQHFKSVCVKKSILHSRLCMREIVRRALIKESIM